MVSLLLYDREKKELNFLRALSRELAALLSEDDWKIGQADTMDALKKMLAGSPLMDMLMYDVTPAAATDMLIEIRKSYKEAQLLVIADRKTSPMRYMRPGIMASSLLLRPWTKEQATEVLREFFQAYMERHVRTDDKNTFVIESKEGNLHIPYEKIYFFEAREKKVFACIGREEYGFYDTIDNLAGTLPAQFVRCHRGFIVNQYKIRKIQLSQNVIYLADDLDVPLSRSYKPMLKELGR